MGKKIISLIKNMKRTDITEEELNKRYSRKMKKNEDPIQDLIEALESMTPAEQGAFASSLTPEQQEQIATVSGDIKPRDDEEREEEPVAEEVPAEEPETEEPVAAEAPVEEAPIEEAPAEEEPVREEVPAEEVAETVEPTVDEREDVPLPLQTVCPHCKRQIDVEGQQEEPEVVDEPVENPIPGPLRNPDSDHNPY